MLFIHLYVYLSLIFRGFCHSIFGADSSGSSLCAKKDVCEQWAWSESLQAWNTDYGKNIIETKYILTFLSFVLIKNVVVFLFFSLLPAI